VFPTLLKISPKVVNWIPALGTEPGAWPESGQALLLSLRILRIPVRLTPENRSSPLLRMMKSKNPLVALP
jgi:hypothetical protein